jgi:hypothetical protein
MTATCRGKESGPESRDVRSWEEWGKNQSAYIWSLRIRTRLLINVAIFRKNWRIVEPVGNIEANDHWYFG